MEGGAYVAVRSVRVKDRDSLANFLGWFSIALGTAQVTMPRMMCRLVGSSGKGSAPSVMRLMGVREIAQGTGILSRPRPTTWVWSRVAGDALDLSLLGVVAARNSKHRLRTAFAIANVVGITVPDVFESLHLAQKKGDPRSGMLVSKAVTIRKSQGEIEQAIDDELRQKLQQHGAVIRYADAPGGRGTEVIVEWTQDPPLGEIGALASKVSGNDLATQLADDLRRLKQRLETGEVVRSDAVPAGHQLGQHLKQRPAQPLVEAVR
jgi:hypothetical protein